MSNPGLQQVTKADIDKLRKKIDRTRHQVKALREKAPNSPALKRAEQFLSANNMTSFSQTSKIKTKMQYDSLRRFLDKFEKYETRTVRGARKAEANQTRALADILGRSGVDTSKYSVKDFYERLNNIDIYGMMYDYGMTSGQVMNEAAILMSQNKRVTAQKIINNVFGQTTSYESRRAGRYNKNTKAYKRRKTK